MAPAWDSELELCCEGPSAPWVKGGQEAEGPKFPTRKLCSCHVDCAEQVVGGLVGALELAQVLVCISGCGLWNEALSLSLSTCELGMKTELLDGEVAVGNGFVKGHLNVVTGTP